MYIIGGRSMGFRAMWGVIFLSIWILHTDVFADGTFRCKGHIISVGDYQAEVLRKCGQPDQTEAWEENEAEVFEHTLEYRSERYRERHRASKLIKAPIRVERWTYNLGPQKFIRYLTFKKSELVKIETGGKGSR